MGLVEKGSLVKEFQQGSALPLPHWGDFWRGRLERPTATGQQSACSSGTLCPKSGGMGWEKT